MENMENNETNNETKAPEVKEEEKPKVKSYHPIEVRPMVRSQVRAFRSSGFDPALNPEVENDPSKVIQMIDYVIDNVYGDLSEQTEKLEFYQLRDLATDTYIRVNRGPEAIKN